MISYISTTILLMFSVVLTIVLWKDIKDITKFM